VGEAVTRAIASSEHERKGSSTLSSSEKVAGFSQRDYDALSEAEEKEFHALVRILEGDP